MVWANDCNFQGVAFRKMPKLQGVEQEGLGHGGPPDNNNLGMLWTFSIQHRTKGPPSLQVAGCQLFQVKGLDSESADSGGVFEEGPSAWVTYGGVTDDSLHANVTRAKVF
ncbi:hypothetical protein JCM31598_29760 [Desulfonatronum parangueonense]